MITFLRKISKLLRGGIVHLDSRLPSRGCVLISYTTLPFIEPGTLNGHTNRWECMCIAQLFTDLGYTVDIVDYTNQSFVPKKHYSYCIDVGNNLKKFSEHLPPECIKIYHITGADWKFQNEAEMQRLHNLEKRRGVKLLARRIIPPSDNIKYADVASILGNEFTIGTYAHTQKHIQRIPISTTHTYPSPEKKNFENIRRNFVWIGGSGMVHKGLDLVLESFSSLPEFTLTIFGKKDDDFAKTYAKELFETPNISYEGVVDLGSEKFIKTASNSIGLIFPSCSEGSSGGVVTAMHAGLIPIISYESGVDVSDFGVILKENTVEEITKQVKILASSNSENLRRRSVDTWNYAQNHHTRQNFLHEYQKFIQTLEASRN